MAHLRSNNVGHIIFFYLSINSIWNKFEGLCELVAGNADILCIAETKLNSQFLIPGFYKPLRTDVNNRRGGLLFPLSLPYHLTY